MLLYNQGSLYMRPKSQFLGAGCKIYVPVKFEFWENCLVRLVELNENIQKNIYNCFPLKIWKRKTYKEELRSKITSKS